MVNVKICLLGDGNVGKTSIKTVFSGQKMNENYTATIGAGFTLKDYNYVSGSESARIRFMIYDLAGQPRYNAVRRQYIMGSHAALLVYDISNRDSYDNMTKWLIQFKQVIRNNVPLVLVANKIDLRNDPKYDGHPLLTTEDGKLLAEKLRENIGYGALNQFYFLEVSAKNNQNINDAFDFISHKMYRSFLQHDNY